MNDVERAVQTPSSTTLNFFYELFKAAASGHGPNRIQALTHDTKKALCQTMGGLIEVCNYFYGVGFKYILLGTIQSDRIEGEFSVYRASTGSNLFMASSDVKAGYRKRLTKFSATFLEKVEKGSKPATPNTCLLTTIEDAEAMEHLISISLTSFELYSAAYVAGWLEKKMVLDF